MQVNAIFLVVVEAVVDETVHDLATGDAGPAAALAVALDFSGSGGGRWWLQKEKEDTVFAGHRVRERVRRHGAAGVQVEVAALVLAPVPGANAGLHAPVANEEPAVVPHPVQLVARVVGWVL